MNTRIFAIQALGLDSFPVRGGIQLLCHWGLRGSELMNLLLSFVSCPVPHQQWDHPHLKARMPQGQPRHSLTFCEFRRVPGCWPKRKRNICKIKWLFLFWKASNQKKIEINVAGKGFFALHILVSCDPPPGVVHVGVALCEDPQIKLWQLSKDIHGSWQSIFL